MPCSSGKKGSGMIGCSRAPWCRTANNANHSGATSLAGSALDRIDLDRLDLHSKLLEPDDGALDLLALTVERERDDADFIGHAGLADIGHDFEFLAKLPEHRLGDEAGGEHEPEALFVFHEG